MKNRTVIGIVCVVLAVAVTFLVSPLVNKVTDQKTEVVRFVANISKGAEIKETDVETVKISNSALPEKTIKDKTQVVGNFAVADIFKGDFATESKITDKANTADDIMSSLKGDKLAMSISINTFAGGLSGKIQNGDIVSICVTDKEDKTTIPGELKYVKVITTTTSGGIDENDVVENEDGSFELPSTVTVLVNTKQANILAGFEQNAEMHLALVFRGDEKTAQKFLTAQDKVFEKSEAKTDG